MWHASCILLGSATIPLFTCSKLEISRICKKKDINWSLSSFRFCYCRNCWLLTPVLLRKNPNSRYTLTLHYNLYLCPKAQSKFRCCRWFKLCTKCFFLFNHSVNNDFCHLRELTRPVVISAVMLLSNSIMYLISSLQQAHLTTFAVLW